MSQLAEFLVANTWVVGLVAFGFVSVVSLLLGLRGQTPTEEQTAAWIQGAICVVLAVATEYVDAHASCTAWSLADAITWATANIGTSLVIYRGAKRTVKTLKMLFGYRAKET